MQTMRWLLGIAPIISAAAQPLPFDPTPVDNAAQDATGRARTYPIGRTVLLWLALLTITAAIPAPAKDAPGRWLYTQRGTGYSVKKVGLVVYDFQDNLIVVAKAADLKNLNGQYGSPSPDLINPEHFVLAKYDAKERPVWFRKMGEVDRPYFAQLVTDRAGAIYGVSWFKEDVRLFGGPSVRTFSQRGGGDILLVKWSPSGELLYAHHLGGPGQESSSGLALKPNGRLVVVGEFNGSLDLQGRDQPIHFVKSGQGHDFFVAEIGQDGTCTWARQLSAGEWTLPAAIAADLEGNCFVTGGFSACLSFADDGNPIQLQSRGDQDLFLAKYDNAGRLLWARADGGPNSDYGSRVKWDYTGCCYVLGRFGMYACFGEGSSAVRLEGGAADMFMACYSGNGELLGALRVGGSGIKLDPQWTIVMDELGNRYVLGGTMREVQRWPATRASADIPPSPGSALTATFTRVRTPAPPSRFETIGRTPDGAIQIELETHANAVYIIERSADLTDWVPVSTNHVEGGRILIEDSQATEVPLRFYRVRQP